MHRLGYLLIVAGCVVAAFEAVRLPAVGGADAVGTSAGEFTETSANVRWGRYGIAFAVSLLGGGLAAFGRRRLQRGGGRVRVTFESLRAAAGRIATESRELEAMRGSIDVYRLPAEIDARMRADLETFAAARESLAHRFGIQAYADLMSQFAAGERYLNRVWSSAADGYQNEAETYLGRAAEQFSRVAERLAELDGADRA